MVSLIENMEDLIAQIGEAAIMEKMLPVFTTLSGDKTWRIRLAVVQFIPKLAKYISKDTF